MGIFKPKYFIYKTNCVSLFFRLWVVFFNFFSASCASKKPNTLDFHGVKTALNLLRSELDRISSYNKSILINSENMFPLVNYEKGKPFNPLKSLKNEISYLKNGKILLPPGDYIIPVMTYCMDSTVISPNGYNYILTQYHGERSEVKSIVNVQLGL